MENNDKVIIKSGMRVLTVGEYGDLLCEALEKMGCTVVSEGEEYDLKIGVGRDGCKCAPAEMARAEIARMELGSYFKARYAIVSEQGRIVILYDRNEYTDLQGGSLAVRKFIELYLSGEQAELPVGLVRSGYFDLIEEQKKLDADFKAEKWAKLREVIFEKYGDEFGEELYRSFETYYGIFKDSLVDWYANLYDPEIGGFYCSTSGKEHFGFLPNVEYTYRSLGALASWGVFPRGWKNSVPKMMKYRLAYFMKSCQDPNGFFYHPQMVKAVTDSALNSRGRNLSCGVAFLNELGMKPTYPTQRDDEYDGVTADEWWDGMVASGEISPDEKRPFVPKSLLDYELYLAGKPTFKTKDEAMLYEKQPEPASGQAAPASTAQSNAYLESHAGFDAYLQSKNIDAYPYSCASELNGTYRIIKSASDRLGKCEEQGFWYSGMTLCDMTIDWLNRHINSKGLFGFVDESKGKFAGVGYQNTNGLMKAMPIYNEWGVRYPELLKAARGCLIGITSPEPSIGNICETYNIWEAFSGLIINAKNFAPEDEREQTLAEIRRVLAEIGPAAVTNTYNKQRRYQKDSGGFSHNIYHSSFSYQGGVMIGCASNEANADANGFGSASVIRAMLKCFEIGEYMPPMYTTWHHMRFVDIVLNLKPVKKLPQPDKLVTN